MDNEKFQRGLRQAASTLLIAAFCGAIGYVIATGVVQYRYGWPEPDLTFIAKNYLTLRVTDARTWTDVNLVVGLSFCLGLLLAARIVTERLTRFGVTHWMTVKELARKNFFGDARTGFVLAKTTGPKQRGKYIVSGKYPHCLVVAPTSRGKGVGFVIPNLLTYKGSAVVLEKRSVTIMTYALCGFSNFASIGIQIAGLGGMAPERQPELAQLAFRAMLGGTLACLMTACVAGLLVG